MFENIGGKMKGLARSITVLGIIVFAPESPFDFVRKSIISNI